jgi:hypothetical protein
LALDCFLPGKAIWIDAAGWSDLLLGVVVGAVKPPDLMVLERRIPTASFQPPNFRNKKYFTDALKISDEIIAIMKPDNETCFMVCSEYVLSSVIEHLKDKGFNVQKVPSPIALRQIVENGYVRWCVEKGVPKDVFQDKRRFWNFLKWVGEMPHLRESLVKTGWASWENKWREEVYKKQE